MKTRNLILISIVALVTLIGATLVYAAPHGGRGHHGGRHGLGMMGPLGHLAQAKEELGLSDAQVTQIKAIFKEVHEKNSAAREQLHGGIGDITATLIANPNDVAGAQAILDRQADAERALKASFLQAASKALNVLTPDQRTKLGEMIAERHERRQR